MSYTIQRNETPLRETTWLAISEPAQKTHLAYGGIINQTYQNK